MPLNKSSNADNVLSSEPNANRNSASALLVQSLFTQLANGQTTLREVTRATTRTKWQKLIGLPAYHWVLFTQLFVILPHAFYLPIWLIIFGIISVVVQLPAIKASKFGRKRLYQFMQLIGFSSGIVGLWLTYGVTFGVDLGVAFLLLCLVSKLWELYNRRDAYVVLNLSLFVLAALFLLNQGLSATLQVLLGSTCVLLAFIAMNDDGNIKGDGRLRSFGLLAGQAIPLMVILFLFFPRLPPLWSLELSGNQATTGVSDSMSPGDFAELSQSTALAFRVEFNNDVTRLRSQLYWRGLVFSDFDGVTWTESKQQKIWRSGGMPDWIEQAWQSLPESSQKSPINYQVILEPTQQDWLYGLEYPFSPQQDVIVTSDFTLKRKKPVTTQLRYDVVQFPKMLIDTTLSTTLQRENLTLPKRGNPQTRAFAKKLFAQSGNDPTRYINAIQQWINSSNFYYTLSPPRLLDNRIDEFLFTTKAGFCEHYSSSFTFMMRAAGIPARVVAGYQGGKLGRDGISWEVRQMDAHAWSEVWLAGRGWVRVDPTAFVAPERVEQGMDAFTSERGAEMFGSGVGAQLSYQQFRMLQSLRRLSDQAGYYWQRDIVGYDQNKQSDTLFKWFKVKSIMQQILWMAIGIGLVVSIVVTLIWYRRRKKWHAADLPIIQLSKRMAKTDEALAINPDEGILDWLTRLEQAAESQETAAAVQTVKSDYRRLRYGKQSMLDTTSPEYRLGLKRLRAHTKAIKG